ncbi:MerR family transcriptional regulator [Brachybacterium sp. FME24]|uniref:MerR family transcriptional regulator n=1 Tax=Brachybacterium sp. FME24 TaxID=2742605 RepID=UPI0018695702|nr:MerR family transcriptional regulator [Brachybacterium sp. FME24]
MTWSTSELARLADTTVPTVRHYHRLGLLDEPGRLSNGYKQYTAAHLARLLQIRRLADRGISLSQIATLLRGDDDAVALDEVDAELKASMRRLARARVEIAALREHRARADTPSGFEDLSQKLTERQRSLLTLFAGVMAPPMLEEFRQALLVGNDVDADFENLPETADEATIEALAQRIAPTVAAARRERPQLDDPAVGSPIGEEQARLVFAHAVLELFHPAQLRVLQRIEEILTA